MAVDSWNDFKLKNPQMEDFFKMVFTDLEHFERELSNYQDNFFQVLATRSSPLIKNNDEGALFLAQFKR